MELTYLSRNQFEQWDRFVETSPQGSIFAKTFYLDALETQYRILVVKKGESIQGGLVLAKNQIGVFSNPMFAKYLGILFRPIEGKYVNRLNLQKQIIETIVTHLKWCKTFDYTFHPAFDNWLPFYWQGYRQETRYTYKISDLKCHEELLNNVESRVRKNIRKAERHGIRIVEDVPLETFYKVNNLTFIRQGARAPFSYEFLKRFFSRLKEAGAIKLLAAYDERGQCHAVTGIVYDEHCAYLLFNGMNSNLPNYEANTLLVMKTIEYAGKVSRVFDFEGSMLRPVERFYRGFGGVLTPYYNIWKNNPLNSLKRFSLRVYKKILYGK